MKTKKYKAKRATIFLMVALLAGCNPNKGGTEHRNESIICQGENFNWKTSKEWKIIVLDNPITIEEKTTFHAKATPFEPWTVKVSGIEDSASKSRILEKLSDHLETPLAPLGRGTLDEVKTMSAYFPEKGQGVYYRGVLSVKSEYSVECPSEGDEKVSGEILTWDLRSPTTGLVDCIAHPRQNSDSKLARIAIEKKCPKGSLARSIL